MRKKNYKVIAEIIVEHTFRREGYLPIILKEEFVQHLSDYFKTDNPTFSKEMFINACEVSDG